VADAAVGFPVGAIELIEDGTTVIDRWDPLWADSPEARTITATAIDGPRDQRLVMRHPFRIVLARRAERHDGTRAS
jgi:hypothetical protein